MNRWCQKPGWLEMEGNQQQLKKPLVQRRSAEHHLWTQDRWSAATEAHTGTTSCQLRAGNWAVLTLDNKRWDKYLLISWVWIHWTQTASTVTRSQFNPEPLGCGGTGDFHHEYWPDVSAAAAWCCYHANMSTWTKVSEERFHTMLKDRQRQDRSNPVPALWT